MIRLEYLWERRPDPVSVRQRIAFLLGLNGFRYGRHVVGDDESGPLREIWVRHAWFALFLPAFDPPACLGLFEIDESCGRDTHGPVSTRAIFAVLANDGEIVASEIKSIDQDPVSEALRQNCLLRPSFGEALDGIGYSIEIGSPEIEAHITFANPEREEIVNLERGLWEMAKSLATGSKNDEIGDYLRKVEVYLRRT